jgi:hypothetical protein
MSATLGTDEKDLGGELELVFITGLDIFNFEYQAFWPSSFRSFVFLLPASSVPFISVSTACCGFALGLGAFVAIDRPVVFEILSSSSPTSTNADLRPVPFFGGFIDGTEGCLSDSRKRSAVIDELKLGRLEFIDGMLGDLWPRKLLELCVMVEAKHLSSWVNI